MHILLLYLQPQLTKVGPINGHSKEKEVYHNRIIKGVLHYQIFRHHTSCSAYIYYYSTIYNLHLLLFYNLHLLYYIFIQKSGSLYNLSQLLSITECDLQKFYNSILIDKHYRITFAKPLGGCSWNVNTPKQNSLFI